MDNSKKVEIKQNVKPSGYFNIKASKTNSCKIMPSFIGNTQEWQAG